MLVFDLPYLFRDRPHMYGVLDGPIGRSFAGPLEERGLVLLGYFEAGLRHLMTRDRLVERTEDLEGLKIRTMENPLHLRSFEAFGASPLPMAYGEVYTALEQGVIDGAEAARSNYFSKRFFEVAPNWSEIGWMYLVAPLVMSERLFSSLAEEDRRAVRAAARKAVAGEREEYRRQDREALGKLREAGVRFASPDRKALMRLARRVWRNAGPPVDPALVEAIVEGSVAAPRTARVAPAARARSPCGSSAERARLRVGASPERNGFATDPGEDSRETERDHPERRPPAPEAPGKPSGESPARLRARRKPSSRASSVERNPALGP